MDRKAVLLPRCDHHLICAFPHEFEEAYRRISHRLGEMKETMLKREAFVPRKADRRVQTQAALVDYDLDHQPGRLMNLFFDSGLTKAAPRTEPIAKSLVLLRRQVPLGSGPAPNKISNGVHRPKICNTLRFQEQAASPARSIDYQPDNAAANGNLQQTYDKKKTIGAQADSIDAKRAWGGQSILSIGK